MKQRIRLFGDFLCYPIWKFNEELGGFSDDIPPSELPLSQSLINDLNTWKEEGDVLDDLWFNKQVKPDEIRCLEYRKQAYVLLERLKSELQNSEYEVDDTSDPF